MKADCRTMNHMSNRPEAVVRPCSQMTSGTWPAAMTMAAFLFTLGLILPIMIRIGI